jgi:hypothetical protein
VDEDGGYWDFSWDVRFKDPGQNQIGGATLGWVSNKPGANATTSRQITDPEEGEYTCSVTWWVGTYELGTSHYSQTVTYAIPTGESTSSNGWAGLPSVYHAFRGSLSGGTFNGRQVREQDGGNGSDNCHFPTSTRPPFVSVTGGTWPVSNNQYGDDLIGWGTTSITYYRNAGMTGGNGCWAEFDQAMEINKGSSWSGTYKTNRIKAGIADTWIWSERDGVARSRDW